MSGSLKKVLVCLVLTGKTLEENAYIARKYKHYADMLELRADFLNQDEWSNVRLFPAMVDLPCILSVRREIDGGKYVGSELTRTIIFAESLSPSVENAKPFAYIEMEDYFHVSSIEDAAMASGCRIIRSYHMAGRNGEKYNLCDKLSSLKKTGYEIPKVTFIAESLEEAASLFHEAWHLKNFDHIISATCPFGEVTTILSRRLNSFLAYTTSEEQKENLKEECLLTPCELENIYSFNFITDHTPLCAITGFSSTIKKTQILHNSFYKAIDEERAVVPLPSNSFAEVKRTADLIGADAIIVASPLKEDAFYTTKTSDNIAKEVGAANLLLKIDESGKDSWCAMNTDVYGFEKALADFIDKKKVRRTRISIIGTGGTARAASYVLSRLGAKVCIFGKPYSAAKSLAAQFGFESSTLDKDSVNILTSFSELIIIFSSYVLNEENKKEDEENPLWFYKFTGQESLLDLSTAEGESAVMREAKKAKIKTENGEKMLIYSAQKQLEFIAKTRMKHRNYQKEIEPFIDELV